VRASGPMNFDGDMEIVVTTGSVVATGSVGMEIVVST
jgi:hypothetical protein